MKRWIKLVNIMDRQQLTKIPKEDRACYFIAKIAAENYRGRKVVTWIRSARFERVLKTYFGLSVAFGISMRDAACDGIKIKKFESLSVKEHYLVVLDRAHDKDTFERLSNIGYNNISDMVFLKHAPIVLENYVCNQEGYKDAYGNIVDCPVGTKIKKVIFRGGGSSIALGSGVTGTGNLTFDISSNTHITIRNSVAFNAAVKFEIFGHNGEARIFVGERCRFTDALFRLYVSPHETAVVINADCTFETHFEAHANTGKRIIIGNDCMISHNVYMLSGDGHAIFDVNTGENLNSDYYKLSHRKNNIVFGNHVWCGYGSFIMNGTNIGSGSIIGAQCVLKGVYPNNCSVAGNPAKVIRKDCAWARDMATQDISSIPAEYRRKTSDTKPSISGQNVLVIGGTRFMGVQLVNELLRLGNKVTIATRGQTKDDFGSLVSRIVFDVSDSNNAKEALKDKKFDVVFDNLAYCSNYVKNVLDNVVCKRYIQLSSIAVYPRKMNLVEEDFQSERIKHEWRDAHGWNDYAIGKKQAEATVRQKYSDISSVIVRIPYVTRTDRLYYYCAHIIGKIPMKIRDISAEMTFVRDTEVGKFLPWIAAQDFTGEINLASTGSIKLNDIINYIENKVGQKAIISSSGDDSPFNEESFSINMNKSIALGYYPSNLNSWFWQLMDEYIARARSAIYQNVTSTEGKAQEIFFSNKRNWNKYVNTMLALDESKCTGCAACANVCPNDAIKMTTDGYGFIKPAIDVSKCVACGLCKNTCPKLNLRFPYEAQKNCYVFMADDETRKSSASGGAFSACAYEVLNRGGVVCGAAWTDDFGLKHIIIETTEELPKIRGSKYLQSSIGDVFRKIKSYLLTGRLVLFVGTPCQVDGLKHYLNKDYSNLYTIDLLCRGVPSEAMFKKYLRESYGGEILKSIVQKSKNRLGWGAYTEIVHQSGYTEHYNMENNIWMKAFLSDFMFRDSCYSCPYPQKKRVGDLSIGDFWQVAKLNKKYDDRLGTSIAIANTPKGKQLIESCAAKLIKSVQLEHELPFNSALFSSRRIPANRTKFFELASKAPIGAALDRALYGKKYDIGIVGWWSNLNYGGTLTYFALNKAITDLGYSVMMIRPPHSDATMPSSDTVPMRFARKHYIISRLYAHRDMHLLNYACKGFVSGSDQLWNPYLEQYAGKECFLSFANQNSLRISYASSFGNVSSFPETFISKYKPELKKFDAVSVREDYAVDLSKKYFDVDATFVCDPVFLCEKSVYEGLARESTCCLPSKFTLNFILDPNSDKSKAIKYVAEKTNVDLVCFTDLQHVEQKKEAFKLQNVYANAEIEDLVKAYAKCDFVVTDSFHGTCFAIIFNKPFISIANYDRGAKRFESLLRWTGLSDRMVKSVDEIYSKPELLQPMDYSKINARVSQLKNASLEWLKEALNKMKY